MLNERNKLIVESNKNLNNNNSDSYNGNLVISSIQGTPREFFKTEKHNFSESNMNIIKHSQLSPSTAQKLSQITLSKCLSNGTNNVHKNGTGNTVKIERLSPPMNELSVYR